MSQLTAKKPLSMLLAAEQGEHRLKRILGPVGLTSIGVGAIIGTGIFVLIGEGAQKAGPSLTLSFVVAGVACVFAALCYAEFASMVPVAGSAYTYAYATLGELMAWIIGWDLVLEYAIGSSAVAHGWSKYFQALLRAINPDWVLPLAIRTAPFDYNSVTGKFDPTHSYLDLPAMLITFVITAILVKGISESVKFNSAMVMVKLAVVGFVILVGAYYIIPANWTPFAPFGFGGMSFFGTFTWGDTDPGGKPLGMLAGSAIIFFSYIGFDAVSNHSEEAKNPKRDLPIGIICSLILCTLLYIAVAAVLTGMIKYNQIDINAPVADAFRQRGLKGSNLLITVGALTGITSVLLVMMLSQPRVLLALARDGLIPSSFFGAVHPRFQTPWKSTILVGVVVSLMGSLLPLQVLAELVSIGTLFAFVVVCAAVLVMRRTHPNAERPFRAPLGAFTPIAGIAICLLIMLSLPAENWIRLVGWLVLGLIVYFAYGKKHSVLAKLNASGSVPAA